MWGCGVVWGWFCAFVAIWTSTIWLKHTHTQVVIFFAERSTAIKVGLVALLVGPVG